MMFFCMAVSTTIWSKTGVNLLLQLPSGNLLQFAIENGPVEIVDLPINSMVDLSIVNGHL